MCPSNDMPSSVGKIVLNLQSLEFALRLVLDELRGVRDEGETQVDFMNLVVGEWVPENYFTNYDALNLLIRKVNSELKSRGIAEQIDSSIVELRDSLAHGRVLSSDPKGPYRILKFSKPKDGKVQVVVSIDITSDWLSQQIMRTESEVRRLINLGRNLGLKCFY